MKKLPLFVMIFLASCIAPEPIIPDTLPEIYLATAYPISDTEVNITANMLARTLKNSIEYGLVWSNKTEPTQSDHKIIIGNVNTSIQYSAKISELETGSIVYVKAYIKDLNENVKYSNEISCTVKKLKNWNKMADLPIKEGQFTGVASKIDGNNLYFLRLDQYNNWELWKHFNGIYRDPNFTWEEQQFRWTQVSPRVNPLFFTVNFNQDYTRPAAFLGGGYIVNPGTPNLKTYVKDLYWVYDTQNYTDPLPIGEGPIAHFTLNRKEYLIEENNPENVWSYFALEPFVKLKPFPPIGNDFHFIGASTNKKGYILAEKKDETELLTFEYDDTTDTWTEKAKFPGKGRLDGVSFSLNNKIYYGLGRNTVPIKGLSDIWEFDPNTNKWKYITTYPGAGNVKVMASGLGDYAILYCGYQLHDSGIGGEKYYPTNDTWQFIP